MLPRAGRGHRNNYADHACRARNRVDAELSHHPSHLSHSSNQRCHSTADQHRRVLCPMSLDQNWAEFAQNGHFWAFFARHEPSNWADDASLGMICPGACFLGIFCPARPIEMVEWTEYAHFDRSEETSLGICRLAALLRAAFSSASAIVMPVTSIEASGDSAEPKGARVE